MRVGRAFQAGRGQAPMSLFGPNNIFSRKLASNAALATDQTPALKLANQLSYGNANYSYNGAPAPSFYGYSGEGWGGFPSYYQTIVNFKSFTIPLYIVDNTVPTQNVTFVQYSSEFSYTVRSPGNSANLQSYFTAVPIPDVTKIPQGQIWSSGSDRHACIWRPSTDEYWEMWRLYSTDNSFGSYVFGYGSYTANFSASNAIWPNGWGARAVNLAATGGLITQQDIIGVLRGLPIQHAIACALASTAPFSVLPSTRNDSHSDIPPIGADGSSPNPAYTYPGYSGTAGYVDAIGEGTWCRFPASLNPATAMPGAGPIALAIATAIRDYGVVLVDGSGTSSFYLEDPRVLGSPYSYAKVNAFAGAVGNAAGTFDTNINNFVPTSWTDPTLPKISEPLTGPNNVMQQMPWNQLQQLQPFSS